MGNRGIQPAGMGTERTGFFVKPAKSLPVIICFSIPLLLLISAYFYMTTFYHKLWLFNTIVHENGKYTLLEVIFYFKHFNWEMPIKILYAVFIVGIFYYYGNPLADKRKVTKQSNPSTWILISLISVLTIIAVTTASNIIQDGYKETALGFFQHKTADARPPEFGSHWRNHFLSNIVLFSASAIVVLLYRIIFCNGMWKRRKFYYLLPFSIVLFVTLTFIYGFTMDPFINPSYLGHQLREIFGTDLSITMLLATGLLIYMEGRFDSRKETNKIKNKEKGIIARHLAVLIIPAVLPAVYLILKVLSLDVSGEIASIGKTANWSVLDLFAWHFFEHSLDYLLVCSLVCFLYLLTLKKELRRTTIEK
ncbi:MAG: hypothetical protein HY757_01380 [Nitrospirae bacterium]|nr:hypothetical protein [Nitrospirota bacterium]